MFDPLAIDFTCDSCGKALHFDPYDDLEGDSHWVVMTKDGKGGEFVLCESCEAKREGKLSF